MQEVFESGVLSRDLSALARDISLMDSRRIGEGCAPVTSFD
jgi:hypothetical protein